MNMWHLIMSTRLQHHCLHDSSWELVPVGNIQNKLLLENVEVK